MYSDHFVAGHGFFLQCLFAPLGAGAATLPGFGPEHFELMRQVRRLGTFGAMLLDAVGADNRVVWDPALGRARIFYRLSPADRTRLAFAAETRVEVMFAAGAREVLLPSEEPLPPLDTPWFTDRSQAALCRAAPFRRPRPCSGRRTARARPRWARIPRRRSSTRAASRTRSAT